MSSISAVPSKPGKVQLNLWISEDLNKALVKHAPERHLRGRTQLAEMIIEEYLATLARQRRAPVIRVAEAKTEERVDQRRKRGG